MGSVVQNLRPGIVVEDCKSSNPQTWEPGIYRGYDSDNEPTDWYLYVTTNKDPEYRAFVITDGCFIAPTNRSSQAKRWVKIESLSLTIK